MSRYSTGATGEFGVLVAQFLGQRIRRPRTPGKSPARLCRSRH